MSRPEKSDEEKRDHSIEVRVTFAEKNTIKQTAKENGLTVSDFMRVRAVDAKPIRKIPNTDRELLLKHLAETNKQGSNLNQIAHVLNSKKDGEMLSYGLLKTVEHAVQTNEQLANRLMELLTW